ncbi:MAG: DUF177 domain-containing protein [Betaproteobacteria bacterium]|nr:DUF177 domain-containing protein [Betaproteobacteria bacterium]
MIDGLEFARNRKTLHGKITVASLGRLHDQLFSDEGELEYTVRGELDPDANPMLHLAIRGTVQLRCQRCLGRFALPLELESRLLLVQDESELGDMVEEPAEVDRIVVQPRLDARALLEDEILLVLPISPRHPEGECQAGIGSSASAAKDKPFAVLSALKKRD